MVSENNSDLNNALLGEGGKVVLGFSGGLDTTYCVKYLTDEKGYEVHSVIVNTGGFTDDELVDLCSIKNHKHEDKVKLRKEYLNNEETLNKIKEHYEHHILKKKVLKSKPKSNNNKDINDDKDDNQNNNVTNQSNY